jgi:sugar-specific transcriptional regulator TrmB
VASLVEASSTLTELGLNASQARAYLALAKNGIMNAHEISKASNIARPHVYTIMAELEEAGLVVTIIGSPELFQAISIEEAISILLKRRITKTADLQEKAAKLTMNFKNSQSSITPKENIQFMLIPKRDAVYAKAEKMLTKAQENIAFLCLTKRMISWLSVYQSGFEAALARKVDCRVIMPKPEPGVDTWKPINALISYHNFNLRLISKDPKFEFSVWDNKEVLFTTSPIDTAVPATTLWSNNRGLVDLCTEHFDCIWNEAEEVEN